MFIYCMYSVLSRGSFCFTASIRRGMEVISLWHCWGGMEIQVSLTVAFSSFFGLSFLIFLLTIPYRFSMGFRSGEFAGQSSTQHHAHLINFWCFWQCGQVPNPDEKWNQHLWKAGQQKEAKIITIKRFKDLNYFSLCAFNWFNTVHEFHNLSWITEINELFHNILIYRDAPVYICSICIYKYTLTGHFIRYTLLVPGWNPFCLQNCLNSLWQELWKIPQRFWSILTW